MAAINDTSTWKKIEDHVATSISKTHLKDLLQDEARCSGLVVEHDGLHIDYSRQQVLPETMDMLFELADTAELSKKMQAMSSGAHVNMTENRSVLHFALRSPEGDNIQSDGINVVPNVHAVRKQISDFSARVRGGEWKGCTGKAIKNIISVGIGGSYLGPEFVYESLRNDSKGSAAAKGRTLRFLANVDPVDCSRAVEDLDPETTMICIVSKTFTTAETMMNARTALNWLVDKLLGSSRLGITGMSPQVTRESIVRQHVVAVSTAVEKATKFGIDAANIFPFWDWVGGRYSVCSAVGLLPLSLHYGYDIMSSFLEGASAMDTHFFEAPLRTNLPVILGLLGVYNATFLGYHTRAVLPYSQALCRFPAHIQQLEMESNGKRIHTDGSVCQFNCGEIIFGEPGTNGQHSFYQLIHQGSRIIPCEFIGFVHSQTPMHDQVIDNHDELMSNFFAQPDALAQGKTQQDLILENVPKNLLTHKEFPGNRPSTTILLPTLNAYTCGQLLALYEHRTAVQGFIWGINSFDQWGVELGKVLGVKVRNTLLEAKHISEIQTDGDSASEDDLSGLNLKGYNHSTQSLLKYYIKQKKHTPSE